ncbi:MAG: Gfo/Idh/MocA family oxidoreductase, partial [bacterium]|nr:Gfo/Idh/MocA family oxidoreductase [bacterium]
MSDRENVTRRDFIRTGAVAGAAAALATTRSHAAEPKPVRIGFVGVGRRGTHLLDTLLQLPGVEIPAVCDVIPAHASAAQDRVEKARGTRPVAYTKGDHDYENLVKRDDLDAVVTATPWNWHTPVMVAAMRAGKCAATEVPAAITVEQCWELVNTSEETGKPCMMLENVCYFKNVLTLLRMVREGCFGDLMHAQAGYQHDVRFLFATDDGKLTWRGEIY